MTCSGWVPVVATTAAICSVDGASVIGFCRVKGKLPLQRGQVTCTGVSGIRSLGSSRLKPHSGQVMVVVDMSFTPMSLSLKTYTAAPQPPTGCTSC